MGTLHVINKCDATLWRCCSEALRNGDSLLLIEDAIYAVLPACSLAVVALSASVQLYALAEDLAVRGISAKIHPEFRMASYKEFVALSLAHERVVSWQ